MRYSAICIATTTMLVFGTSVGSAQTFAPRTPEQVGQYHPEHVRHEDMRRIGGQWWFQTRDGRLMRWRDGAWIGGESLDRLPWRTTRLVDP
jgi:hypothetical protein